MSLSYVSDRSTAHGHWPVASPEILAKSDFERPIVDMRIHTHTPAPTEQPFLSVSVPTAARMLGISSSHCYDLVRAGVIPSVHLGRRVVVTMATLLRLVADQSAEG